MSGEFEADKIGKAQVIIGDIKAPAADECALVDSYQRCLAVTFPLRFCGDSDGSALESFCFDDAADFEALMSFDEGGDDASFFLDDDFAAGLEFGDGAKVFDDDVVNEEFLVASRA